MFVNTLPRYEILSDDAMAVLDRGWRRIVTEIGVEFLLDEAVEEFRKAGQQVVDGNRVILDPEFLLEQVAKAPREFELQARNPEQSAHIGGDNMVFASVYGCPFVRDGDVRREADDGRLREPREAVAGLPGARLARRHDLRAQRPPARLAPPRHGLRAADAVRQALHGLGHLRARTPRTRSAWGRSCSAARSSRRRPRSR